MHERSLSLVTLAAVSLLACAAPVGADLDGPATDPFFDANDPPTVRLTILASDWQAALWDQVPEDLCEDRPYSPATAEYTNPMDGTTVTLADVGVRWRGHSSLDTEDGGRVGLKLSLNAFEKGRELHGLRKINLMGTEGDFSAMREHLSLRIARDLGVPAPRSGYAHLYVNDEYMGLYPHTEESDDDPYLARNFADDTGHLYKAEGYCGGRGDFSVPGDTAQDYADVYLPKADTEVEDVLSDLVPLIACANEPDDGAFARCAPELIDVDAWLRLIAIDVVLPDVDGMIGAGQNFLIYNDPSIGRMIPWFWDKDLALDDNNMAESWDLAGVHPAWRDDFRSVLGDRLVRTWPEPYCEHVLTVAERAEPANLLPEIEELRVLLEPLLAADPGVDVDRWSWVTDDILNVVMDHQPAVVALAEACEI